MEEGSLRCDANVSVRPVGQDALGTKAEVKNVNSFKYLQQALEFEIARQTEVVASGGRVRQETRLLDSARGETFSMRSKEEAHDYRYFPEPDLEPVTVEAGWIASIRGIAAGAARGARRRGSSPRMASPSTTPTCWSGCCPAAPTTSKRRSRAGRLAEGREQLDSGRGPPQAQGDGRRGSGGVADSSGGAGGAGRARRARRREQLARQGRLREDVGDRRPGRGDRRTRRPGPDRTTPPRSPRSSPTSSAGIRIRSRSSVPARPTPSGSLSVR